MGTQRVCWRNCFFCMTLLNLLRKNPATTANYLSNPLWVWLSVHLSFGQASDQLIRHGKVLVFFSSILGRGYLHYHTYLCSSVQKKTQRILWTLFHALQPWNYRNGMYARHILLVQVAFIIIIEIWLAIIMILIANVLLYVAPRYHIMHGSIIASPLRLRIVSYQTLVMIIIIFPPYHYHIIVKHRFMHGTDADPIQISTCMRQRLRQVPEVHI